LAGVELVAAVLDEGAPVDRRELLGRRWRKLRRVGVGGATVGLALRGVYARAGTAGPLEALGPPVHRVPTLNGEAARALLRRLEADLALSLDNALLDEETFGLPPLGTVNVHHGAVPEYRGGPPVFWELADGRDTVGFVVHRIDAGIDTGPVLAAGEVTIERRPTLDETLAATIPRLHEASLDALETVLVRVADGTAVPAAQPAATTRARTTPGLGDYLRVRRELRRG
jgi:methionyl-tRNA formyltransferase